MAKILLVEDEEKIARFIRLELMHEGYEVAVSHDGREGLSLAQSGGFDLCLLDIMLPGLNGMEVLRRLRKDSDLPVIMVTARDSVMDKVGGLDLGADDYITKPFSIEELLARIRMVLRRRGGARKEAGLAYGGRLLLCPDSRRVSVDGTDVELTAREFDLLCFLLQNKNIVLSRDKILSAVWGYDYLGETNVVDVYVRYLRSKIDDVYGLNVISTVRGVGYVVRENDHE